MGTLYIVSTPIGNIDDITIRAIKQFLSTRYLVCENAPKTNQLIITIQTRYPELAKESVEHTFISANEFEEENVLPKVLQLLLDGNDIAYVSEAGTPLVSDPGFKLVREAIKRDIPVVSIPGASAPIAALTVSGLPTDSFLFIGFLPKSEGKKKNKMEEINKSLESFKTSPTVIFFESPHRLLETLKVFQEVFGDIHIVVTRELTKKFEEVLRVPVSKAIKHFEEKAPKGEFTLLFHL